MKLPEKILELYLWSFKMFVFQITIFLGVNDVSKYIFLKKFFKNVNEKCFIVRQKPPRREMSAACINNQTQSHTFRIDQRSVLSFHYYLTLSCIEEIWFILFFASANNRARILTNQGKTVFFLNGDSFTNTINRNLD